MNNNNYQEQIAFYRSRLLIVVGGVVVFLVGMGVMGWRWYKLRTMVVPTSETALRLETEKFKDLMEQMRERSVPVESGGKILYGGEVGRLEPFD